MHDECGGHQFTGGCGGNQLDRDAMVREKVKELEDRERIATSDARRLTLSLLKEKGYTEIDEDPVFDVSTPALTANVSTDFIVRIGGRPLMAIRCSMALDSRERHVLAFARSATPDIIPLAIVTDGLKAHMLDAVTGRLISESLDAIPAQDEARALLDNPRSIPQDRLRRERMVLLAFESATCHITSPSEK